MSMTTETILTYPAIDQFVDDFTIVVDNNSDAYFETIDLVRRMKGSVSSISDTMREAWEEQVSKALEVLRQSEEIEPITIDIMSEMLNGWGMATFDAIARHYIAKDSE